MTTGDLAAPDDDGRTAPGPTTVPGACVDEVRALEAVADRLDALAETALLMGDLDGAERLHEQSSARRLQALAMLDR